MKEFKKIPINLVFLPIVFILSVVYTFSSFKLPFGSFRSPGPGFIPRIVGIMASVLSVVIFIQDIKKKDYKEFDVDNPKAIWLFVACFIVYTLIFEPVGYVLSTVLFAFALSAIMKNKWWVSIVIGVGTGLAFYVLFSLLAVPLPNGILG